MIMTDELESISKSAVMAYFKELFHYLSVVTEGIHENLSTAVLRTEMGPSGYEGYYFTS